MTAKLGLTGLAALVAGLLIPPGGSASAAETGTLASHAAASGRHFGAAVIARRLTEADYAQVLDREFDTIAPETETAWDAVEPARGTFVYTAADQIVDHAEANGQRVRGRNLVWHAGLPGYLVGLSGDAFSAAVNDHVTQVVGHFRGRVSTWDVVTEAMSDTGTPRNSIFPRRLGDDWIDQMFRAADAADPAADLCYNDHGIESWAAAKTQAVYALVRDMIRRGVPIDCVGLESHFGASAPVPADFRRTIEAFAALGVDVHLSELDVEGSGTSQADAYRTAVSACVAVPRCTDILVYGVTDRYSWRAANTPLLFDGSYAEKPAYAAVVEALDSAAPSSPTTTTAPPTTSTTTTTTTTSAIGDTLASRAARSGRFFGTAVSSVRLADPDHTAILDREFSLVSTEFETAWDTTEYTRNGFDLTRADRIVSYAEARGMRVRGRSLVWHSMLPAWVQAVPRAQFESTVAHHVDTVMGHFAGRVYAWDVVNEAIDDQGALRSSIFRQNLGDTWVEQVFRIARQADPAAKLCYNDYLIEDWTSPKTQAVYSMLRDFKARGVPVDCVGIQAHFAPRVNPVPATFRQTISAFAALGLDVHLTELDVETESQEQQNADYSAAVNACLAVPRCTVISVFGITDRFHWRVVMKPLLWDSDYVRKPSYDAVMDALRGLAATSTTSGPPTTTTTTTTTDAVPACSATIEVLSAWPGGWMANVQVRARTLPIRSWAVSWAFPDGTWLVDGWGAQLHGTTTVTASSLAYNGTLAAGTSTTFTIMGGGALAAPPATCEAT